MPICNASQIWGDEALQKTGKKLPKKKRHLNVFHCGLKETAEYYVISYLFEQSSEIIEDVSAGFAKFHMSNVTDNSAFQGISESDLL